MNGIQTQFGIFLTAQNVPLKSVEVLNVNLQLILGMTALEFESEYKDKKPIIFVNTTNNSKFISMNTKKYLLEHYGDYKVRVRKIPSSRSYFASSVLQILILTVNMMFHLKSTSMN